MTCQPFLSIPFVFHLPLTIGCCYRHLVDRLEVINSAVLQALLLANAVKCCLNECLRACCCLPPLRLLYQIIDLIIINKQKYEPLVINMVKIR